jgi:hypothetical protein
MPYSLAETNMPYGTSGTTMSYGPSETTSPYTPAETTMPYSPAKTTMPYGPSGTTMPYSPAENSIPSSIPSSIAEMSFSYGPAEIIADTPPERMYVEDTIQINVQDTEDPNLFKTYYDGYKKYLNDNANSTYDTVDNIVTLDKSSIDSYMMSMTPNPNITESETQISKNKNIIDYFMNIWNRMNVSRK